MGANTTPRYTEILRQWYQIRVPGANSRTPIGTLKMTYWKSVSTHPVPNNVATADEAENLWLRNVITSSGATPTKGASVGQLWQEASRSQGAGSGASKRDAERLFYLNTMDSGTNP